MTGIVDGDLRALIEVFVGSEPDGEKSHRDRILIQLVASQAGQNMDGTPRRFIEKSLAVSELLEIG